MPPRPDVGDAESSAGLESEHTAADVIGESRWPIAGAVLAVMLLTMLLPDSLHLGPALQAMISLAIPGLVVARAVNVFN